MKTTVEIADPLFAEAKRQAKRRGVTFRELVETGLRRVLAEGRAAPKPFKLKVRPFHGDGLQPGVSWSNLREGIYEGRGE
ncbi:MAG: DUF2191 domain-containing protein [Candidatus Sericytochromatia bacterium]|uniref:DUF2191 domain-containing protein n=1 Tax=Candidatus Tanganyikabacteria bacterium TaxID=2961651 RepID=A0A937X7R8_9BACT|nr:DUF2191 domain-containing protein [Candidatus Tanganyikabacteria bacterium]